MDAYTVAARLNFSSNVQSILERMTRDLATFDRTLKDVQSNVSTLTRELNALRGAGSALSSLTRAMRGLERTRLGGGLVGDMEKAAAASRAMQAAGERTTAMLRDQARFAAETAAGLQASARAMQAAGTAAARGGGAAGGHGRGRFSTHDGIMVGIGAQMAGTPLLHTGANAFERAMELSHLRVQMMADQRVTAAQADAAMQAAFAATSTAPGTTAAVNAHTLIDLKNLLGTLGEAQDILPGVAQLTGLYQALDRRRSGHGDAAFAAMKAMEVMGALTEDSTGADGHTSSHLNRDLLMRRLDALSRVEVATNMRVGPADYLGFAKQSRVAGMTLTDEFIYEKLPAIMMAMGGPRAGTALMSMFQVFQAGKLTAQSMGAL